MTVSDNFESLQAAYLTAIADGDGKAADAALRAIAGAIEADAALRARMALSGAVAPDGATLESVADAWLRLDPPARRAIMSGPEAAPEPPAACEIGEIADPMPPALLALPGDNAAVLPVGEVGILAGSGGTGKSTLASEIALAVAHEKAKCPFDVKTHGPVLWLAYEERPGLIAARAKARGFTQGIHVLDMRGGRWPLFGPGDRGGGAGLYNARPEPLAGWRVMEAEAARVEPRLIVIDPALAAFVGEPNAAPPVREFIERLAAWADGIKASALVLAHATKERETGPFDRAQAGGSGAWTDAARCALTLVHGDGSGSPAGGDARTLAVLKANAGPAFTWTALAPKRAMMDSKWIIGFKGRTWQPGNEWKHPMKARKEPATVPAADTQSASNMGIGIENV